MVSFVSPFSEVRFFYWYYLVSFLLGFLAPLVTMARRGFFFISEAWKSQLVQNVANACSEVSWSLVASGFMRHLLPLELQPRIWLLDGIFAHTICWRQL